MSDIDPATFDLESWQALEDMLEFEHAAHVRRARGDRFAFLKRAIGAAAAGRAKLVPRGRDGAPPPEASGEITTAGLEALAAVLARRPNLFGRDARHTLEALLEVGARTVARRQREAEGFGLLEGVITTIEAEGGARDRRVAELEAQVAALGLELEEVRRVEVDELERAVGGLEAQVLVLTTQRDEAWAREAEPGVVAWIPSNPVIAGEALDPGDVQLISLALANLVAERPGWDVAIDDVAAKISGAPAWLKSFKDLRKPDGENSPTPQKGNPTS